MAADMEANRSMLLLGDLNHTPEAQEYRMWQEAGWIDTFTAAGTGQGPTIPANMPTRRIDYIFARGPIAERIIESRRLYEGAFRLDNHDPHGFALSDHLPHLAVFSHGK
jgi:endonuclease/exonuclease/phosphatase family metal-dependent hydrolase